jgi:hypothetical protein
MPPAHPPMTSKQEQRVQAVLALLRGESAAQVTVQFGICRSSLYKFRGRALKAMHVALADPRRGPQQPHNRLDADREQHVIALCARHPMRSAYRVQESWDPTRPVHERFNGYGHVMVSHGYQSVRLRQRRHNDCRSTRYSVPAMSSRRNPT